MFTSIKDIQEKRGKKRFINDLVDEIYFKCKKSKKNDSESNFEYFDSEQNSICWENFKELNNKYSSYGPLKNELEQLTYTYGGNNSKKESISLDEDDCIITEVTKKNNILSKVDTLLPKNFPLQAINFVENNEKPETVKLFKFPKQQICQSKTKNDIPSFKDSYQPFEFYNGEISKLPKVRLPVVNCKVFASTSLDNGPVYWKAAKITEIIKSIDPKFRIQFDSVQNSSKKLRTLKELACFEAPTTLLPIGTRVIAITEEKNKCWESGVIAETESRDLNGNRVLIFFDSGSASYCYRHVVRQIMKQNVAVWEDVKSEDMKSFLRTYMSKQPDRQMVALREGHQVSLDWNSKWYKTTVGKVDHSMAKLYFEDSRFEWIYRGSTRLKPLYDAIVRENRQHKSNRARKVVGKSDNKSDPFITYQHGTMGKFKRTGVARKSTKPSNNIYKQDQFENKEIALNPVQEKNAYGMRVIAKEKNRQSKEKKGLETRACNPHSLCNETCVTSFESNMYKYGRKLMRPLHSGWYRQVVRFPSLKDKKNVNGKNPSSKVIYFSPCGKLLANMDDIDEYLLQTKSKLTIDCFSINLSVNVHATFCTKGIKVDDISNDLEKVPISLANIYNEDMPRYMRYRTRRNPMKEVIINDDPGFLVCCDCKDGCRNKQKCACWQLTYEIQGKSSGTKLGYNHKRLSETIRTGIYECNRNCSCKTECNNRVVQNDIDYRIQLFKTSKKGWGVRTNEDIPKGAFVCHYVGQMLSDTLADESGKQQGDEFFCDLDYIEQAEDFKEGYEENAYQSSDDNDDDDYIDERNREIFNKDAVISEKNKQKANHFKLRAYFGADGPIVMDAKAEGNIGRYFNHSCNPNMIVQNVFVDTHDPRYPWIAFFTNRSVEAGEELTWDYGYEVNCVPGRVIYCLCGEECCRGRLL